MFFARIFRRKVMKAPVRTLRIDGTKTTLTPKPDDAELAAQALLESKLRPTPGPSPEGRGVNSSAEGTFQYYKDLSEKIKAAHEADKRAAMRYVAYCEAQITSAVSHQPSDLVELERQLYVHQDAVEREGGELLKRWQKCLALVIVRQYNAMKEEDANTDDTDMTDETDPSDKDTETTG